MERQPEVERLQTVLVAAPVQLEHRATGIDRGVEGAAAGRLVVQPEYRENGVADELQDLAPMALDRERHAIEVVVQAGEQGVPTEPFGQRREAAQIAVPDSGLHGLGAAAGDLSLENPLAGVAADIGVEQIDRDAPIEMDLEQ